MTEEEKEKYYEQGFLAAFEIVKRVLEIEIAENENSDYSKHIIIFKDVLVEELENYSQDN